MPQPPQPPAFPRPWNHPLNVRFIALVICGILVAYATRFNGCDRDSIVRAIFKNPQVGQTVDGVSAIQAELASVAASVAATDAKLSQILAMEHRVVYTFDPRREHHPDPTMLELLRALAKAGAEFRVVLQPAIGTGLVENITCVSVRIDESANVTCTGPERPSNLMLPDGRRYQETIRHDGSMFFAHWDASGSNVQGQREMGQWSTVWLARGPLTVPPSMPSMLPLVPPPPLEAEEPPPQ